MNDYPSQKEVERIKKMYPKGTRILIERMNDPYHPIERGTKGTVAVHGLRVMEGEKGRFVNMPSTSYNGDELIDTHTTDEYGSFT